MQQPLEAQRRASLGRVSMRERFGVAQVASAYEALYRQAMTPAATEAMTPAKPR